jgi:L-methionine (R)-S-oxide reductase
MDAQQVWLDAFIAKHGGAAGTVHLRRGDVLELCASLNIPLAVQAVTRTIARGKGMAGLAWERGEPVQTCNLQTDASGDVRPGARAVSARAAVALPVLDDRGQVRAVVGIAFADERELGEQELAALGEGASELP